MFMLWKRRRLSSAIALLAMLAACTPDGQPESERGPVVTAPVAPVAGIARALLPPDLLDVVVLVPAGANPATYEPSIRDLRLASRSLLYLEVGHPSFVFERTWLDGLLEGSSAERLRLFDECPTLADDAHAWLSTRCLDAAARGTADALVRLLPEYGPQISANLRIFRDRVAAAQAMAAQRLAEHRGNQFFVLHPAWGYFARDHGLEQVEILSHGTGDPGASRLARLIQTGREEGIQTVFVQPQFNSEPAELIAREIGARVVSLDPLSDDPVAIVEQTAAALATAFGSRIP